MQTLREKRYSANLELLAILNEIVMSDIGNQRFSQILDNFGFVKNLIASNTLPDTNDRFWVDEYNLEPNVLVERVKAEFAKVNS